MVAVHTAFDLGQEDSVGSVRRMPLWGTPLSGCAWKWSAGGPGVLFIGPCRVVTGDVGHVSDLLEVTGGR